MKKKWMRLLAATAMLTFAPVVGISGKYSNVNAETVKEEVNPEKGHQLEVTNDRKIGSMSYRVSGIDIEQTTGMEVLVLFKESSGKMTEVLKKSIIFDEENCIEGIYNGTVSINECSKKVFGKYTLSVRIGEEELVAKQDFDFSMNAKDISTTISGKNYENQRTVKVKLTNKSEEQIIPGEKNKVALYIWKKGTKESSAKEVGTRKTATDKNLSWSLSLDSICKEYGSYYAQTRLVDSPYSSKVVSFDKVEFTVSPVAGDVEITKSSALEKKKAFAVQIGSVKTPIKIKKVEFLVYNSKNKLVHTKKATDKKGNQSLFYSEIKLKDLDYKFGTYRIGVKITDKNNNSVELAQDKKVEINTKVKSLSISKNKKSYTTSFTLKGAYVPGNIKKVQFKLYKKEKGKEKLNNTFAAKYSSKNKTYTASAKNRNVGAGSYVVYAYATTSWNKQILLIKETLKITADECGKSGWFYEKYNGKTYKFYYVKGEKQTDLTKLLGITGTTNLYIELNRAACTVTAYAYDSEKKAYIIPVKSFAVSVGRDTYTAAGAGALNVHSSFTPIGDYSICTNGTSVKYSVKPMHEPDGSTVYARWTSHIVGNVYFHSIAVGANSHYALNPNTYNRLGSPASAGCIRMAVADAKWIYDHAATGSKVKIARGDSGKPGPLGKPKTIKVYSSSVRYDPTDPDVPDSTKKSDYKAGRISGYMTKAGVKVGY